MHLPEAHLRALRQTFDAFAPEHCERWMYLLGKDPSKWGKITPIRVWPLISAYDSSADLPLERWLSVRTLAPHASRETIVLRCGHSRNPGTAVVALRDVLAGGRRNHDVVFEGFVCVVPGKLALGFNHEGGVCVFGA